MVDSNKKKIRGWKRRMARVDSWFEKSKAPDLESFQSRGEDYVKVRIDPWNRLCERIPPSWYFRLIIGRLIDVHDEWKQAYKGLNRPFDLQIWLNDPNSIRSQVVCASVDAAGQERNNYYRISKDKIKFPHAKWNSDKYDLSRFEWTLFDDEDLRFKNAEGLNDEEIKELDGIGFKGEQTVLNGRPEAMYVRKVGHVWVGREK
jgi:hypothetical protein